MVAPQYSPAANISDPRAYGAIATIDLDALCANYRLLAQKAAPAVCSAVVKANAYGLGVAKVAPALYQAGCRLFFVVQPIEALELQPLLPPDAMIGVLNGIANGHEAMIAAAGIWPVLNSWQAVKNWQILCQNHQKRFPAILQVDSGMNRLGLDQDEQATLLQNLNIFKDIDIKYIISHLACADQSDHPTNKAQLSKFKALLASLPPCPVALANAGGILLGKAFHFDMVRPGIGLYGVDPQGHMPSRLKPVLGLEARVLQSRTVPAGSAIGYGGSAVVSQTSIITTVGMGYADGWPFALNNKGVAYYKGQRLPIIGRLSMDAITLDATQLGDKAPLPGDFIEFIGPHQSLEDVAKVADTIPYQILTALGRRYLYIYKQENKGELCP
ncbi:alanine racemase [Bartonella sp. DGB2]|uniref:alanine racemase n=1 Tax=Bartonella sp. DGB2 TaxID=3388426 RepID=UPI00398FF400